MELHSNRVVLRSVQPEDAPQLLAIGREPSVQRWWNAVHEEDVVADADGNAVRFAVLVDGERAGLVQYEEELEPDFRTAWIDIFLGERWQGRGLGAETIRTVCRHLLDERGHHRLTIDPAAANEAAIRCYASVGFRPVGVMRQYWRNGDGVWCDGLLMDLLAAELT